jgi:hypothetical protein
LAAQNNPFALTTLLPFPSPPPAPQIYHYSNVLMFQINYIYPDLLNASLTHVARNAGQCVEITCEKKEYELNIVKKQGGENI